MDLTKFKEEYAQLISEMRKAMDEPENNREIIDDGVYNPEKYFSNEIRLCWMLKEPYDDVDGTGGGWSYLSMFEGEDLYDETFRFGHRTTWHPIIYTSFGIYNNFRQWGEIDYLRENHEIAKIVREVAFVNAQKLPSKGVTRTNFNDIIESIGKHGSLIEKQVKMLNPNVLIFANTFDAYRKLFGLDESKVINAGSCSYITLGDSIYINAYHPAQTQVKADVYCNDIINVVKNWCSNK